MNKNNLLSPLLLTAILLLLSSISCNYQTNAYKSDTQYLQSIARTNRYVVSEMLLLADMDRILYRGRDPFNALNREMWDIYERTEDVYHKFRQHGEFRQDYIIYIQGLNLLLLEQWKKIMPAAIYHRYQPRLLPLYPWQRRELQLAILYTNLGSLAASVRQMYRLCFHTTAFYSKGNNYRLIQAAAEDYELQPAQMIFLGRQIDVRQWLSIKETQGLQITAYTNGTLHLHKTAAQAFITLEFYDNEKFYTYCRTFFL